MVWIDVGQSLWLVFVYSDGAVAMLCLSVIDSISSTFKVCRSGSSTVWRPNCTLCPLCGISGSHSTTSWLYAETVRVNCCSCVCQYIKLSSIICVILTGFTYLMSWLLQRVTGVTFTSYFAYSVWMSLSCLSGLCSSKVTYKGVVLSSGSAQHTNFQPYGNMKINRAYLQHARCKHSAYQICFNFCQDYLRYL